MKKTGKPVQTQPSADVSPVTIAKNYLSVSIDKLVICMSPIGPLEYHRVRESAKNALVMPPSLVEGFAQAKDAGMSMLEAIDNIRELSEGYALFEQRRMGEALDASIGACVLRAFMDKSIPIDDRDAMFGCLGDLRPMPAQIVGKIAYTEIASKIGLEKAQVIWNKVLEWVSSAAAILSEKEIEEQQKLFQQR